MTRLAKGLALAAALASLAPPAARAWDRGRATRFATLPPGTAHPEGLAIDADGNVFVADFDVSKASGPGQLVAFDHAGRLLRVVNVAGSSPLLLGLDFHRVGSVTELLVLDFGGGQVLRVDPVNGSSSLFAPIPVLDPASPSVGPNALTFDRDGNVYVSDSFQGAIFKAPPGGGAFEVWARSDLLRTSGVPPFGANGIAFDRAGSAMFVANTGNDTVVKIPVATRAPEVFANSVNGADGLAIDPDGNIWVCANQSDELVVLDPRDGHALAKLGDFDGLSSDGAPVGLLFPASLAFRGEFVYVTNLALDLRLFNAAFNAVDSAWTAKVEEHTVARLSRRFAPARGD